MADVATGSGLRQEKKRRTRSEILANAIAIFREKGVRRTQLAEIARASRVSPATLFNYFPTKSCLAEAWVRGEVQEALIGMARELGDHGLRPALRTVCRVLANSAEGERVSRLEAWSEVGRAHPLPDPGRRALAEILRREQKRERVRKDLSAELLAEALTEAIESGLIAALREDVDANERAGCLRSRVDLILDGARKKNERVRPPRLEAAAGRERRARF